MRLLLFLVDVALRPPDSVRILELISAIVLDGALNFGITFLHVRRFSTIILNLIRFLNL